MLINKRKQNFNCSILRVIVESRIECIIVYKKYCQIANELTISNQAFLAMQGSNSTFYIPMINKFIHKPRYV